MDSDDDFGCLGIPSPLEMWKQQSVLLATEIEEYQRDLRKARVNVAKLVLMNEALTVERDRLQVELSDVAKKLSESYLALSTAENMLYVYRGRPPEAFAPYATPAQNKD